MAGEAFRFDDEHVWTADLDWADIGDLIRFGAWSWVRAFKPSFATPNPMAYSVVFDWPQPSQLQRPVVTVARRRPILTVSCPIEDIDPTAFAGSAPEMRVTLILRPSEGIGYAHTHIKAEDDWVALSDMMLMFIKNPQRFLEATERLRRELVLHVVRGTESGLRKDEKDANIIPDRAVFRTPDDMNEMRFIVNLPEGDRDYYPQELALEGEARPEARGNRVCFCYHNPGTMSLSADGRTVTMVTKTIWMGSWTEVCM